MKKIAILTLTLLLLGLCAEAKVGKIKYGKYIIYEGEIANDAPSGQGSLIITDVKDKNIVFISINGNFNDKVITEATFNATDFNALEFEGEMSFEPVGEKGKSTEINFHLGDGTLYHDDIEYLYKRIRNIRITELQINVSTSKQAKEWTIAFGPNATQSTSFKGIVPNMPLPRNVDLLGYSSEKISGFYADFDINEVLINSSEEGRYVFNDGSYFQKDVMHFTNGDEVHFANNDWTGSMTYADGTRITKDAEDNFRIDFENGDIYMGTLKRNTLQDLARRGSDRPNFKFNNGIMTSAGETEKWIWGESFSQRHARLSEIMRAELVSAVENETMTEQQATRREKELKAEEEKQAELLAARRLEFSDDSLMKANSLSPALLSAVKGKKFGAQVSKKDTEGQLFAKKVQLWLTIQFVSATRCIVKYNGKMLAQDEATGDYFTSLEQTFIDDGNFAYRIEGSDIVLYDVTNYERQPLSFRCSKGIVTCNELSGQLKLKK